MMGRLQASFLHFRSWVHIEVMPHWTQGNWRGRRRFRLAAFMPGLLLHLQLLDVDSRYTIDASDWAYGLIIARCEKKGRRATHLQE
jgi:hypothetical protein